MFSAGDLVVDYDKYPDFIGIVYYINNDELYSVKVKFYKDISTTQKKILNLVLLMLIHIL